MPIEHEYELHRFLKGDGPASVDGLAASGLDACPEN